jgi:hypothetical protein
VSSAKCHVLLAICYFLIDWFYWTCLIKRWDENVKWKECVHQNSFWRIHSLHCKEWITTLINYAVSVSAGPTFLWSASWSFLPSCWEDIIFQLRLRYDWNSIRSHLHFSVWRDGKFIPSGANLLLYHTICWRKNLRIQPDTWPSSKTIQSSSDVNIVELPRFTRMHYASGIAFLGMTRWKIYSFGSKFNIASHHMLMEESSDSTWHMA